MGRLCGGGGEVALLQRQDLFVLLAGEDADVDPFVHRDRLLVDAKTRALELAKGYRPPDPIRLTLPGPAGKAALGLALRDLRAKSEATAHDEAVAGALAEVLTGGPEADPIEPVSEDEVLRLERAAFMRLVKTEATLARIEHMLATGKPLRN